MSDNLSDKKLELKNAVLTVKDVTKWHDLGLQLGLSDAILESIAMYPDIEGRLRRMLSKWLRSDTEASWEKLADALTIIGEKVAAENIRRQFMEKTSIPDNPCCRDDTKIRCAMTATALRKIKSRFSLLVIKVQSSMEKNKVKVTRLRQFLLNFFEGNCSIPDVTDLDKIFNTITEAKLWGYGNYGPLEELAESFLPEDDPARAQVTEYKSQLSGFYTTTSIIDFINLSEYGGPTEDEKLPFSPKKYSSYYHKLTVELKLDRSVKLSELTLDYVDKLWKALMQEFHLPPLTAVMDKIVEGSLKITWLILSHIMEKIKAVYFKSITFFQRYSITRIEIDGFLLYDELLVSIKGLDISMHVCKYKDCPLYKAPPCFTNNLGELLSSHSCYGTSYPDWKQFIRYFDIEIPVSEEGAVTYWVYDHIDRDQHTIQCILEFAENLGHSPLHHQFEELIKVHLLKGHGHTCTSNPADCFIQCAKCKSHRLRSKSESKISHSPVKKIPVSLCPTQSLPISSPAAKTEDSSNSNENGAQTSSPISPSPPSPQPEPLPGPDEVIHVLAPSLFDKEYPYKLFLGNFWILEPIIVLFLAFQTLSSIFITLCENGGAYTVFHDGLNVSEFINRIIILLLHILVRVVSPFVFYRQICSMAEAEKALQVRIKKEDYKLPSPKPVPHHKHVTLWSIISHAVLFSIILLYLDAFLTAEDRLNDNSIGIKKLFRVQVPLIGRRLFEFCDYLSCFFILMLVGLVKDCYCIENRLSTANNKYFDIIRQRWYRIDFFCYTIPLLLTLFSIVSLSYNRSITPVPTHKVDAGELEIWCFWMIVLSLLLFFGSSTNWTARIVTVVGNILALCCAFFFTVVLGVEKATYPPGSIMILIFCHLSMTTINLLYCLTKAHGRHKKHRSRWFWLSLTCLILLTISLFAIVVREVICLAISVV